MKKVLALTLALLMAMSMMVACNNDGDKGDKFVSPAASAAQTALEGVRIGLSGTVTRNGDET